MKSSFLLSIMILFSGISMAQKQNNIWYFGDQAGLDFNTDPPTPIESDLFTLEGTAVISDPAGHLLFYTNGATIWDRNHNVMPNGNGLLGGESSTQAALIVPLPNSCNLYYVFTTEDHFTDGGLAYSIVDMCLNEGLGDVVVESKNIPVVNQTTEKITAVLHSNGVDIWILTHTLNSDEFLAYLLSSTGLSSIPVVSSIGSFYSSLAIIGPIKVSHDGTKIVSSASFHNICEMFDFDPATGELTNFFDLNQYFSGQQFVYGLEFSPNNKILYISTFFVTSNLFQLDLDTEQLTTLNTVSGNYHYGALQIGSNKKIYMARNESGFIDVIHQPNMSGTDCQYEEGGQPLVPGTTSQIGLPNIAPYSFFLDSITELSLGNDTTLCMGESLALSLTFPSNCPVEYIWSDGSTEPVNIVTQPGTYWVDAESSCIHFRDTIQIDFLPTPSTSLNVEICSGESYEGYTESGTYSDTFAIQGSCDSIRILHLTVQSNVNTSLEKAICSGESFEGYSQTGVYVDTFHIFEGCDSIRTLHLNVLSCVPIVSYDLDACTAFMFNGTNMDYTEFVPSFPTSLECAEVTANYLFRAPPQMNKHSCTPGINNSPAMCISALNSCNYVAGHQASVVIEIMMNPPIDSVIKLTRLEFFEKSPITYNWISGDSGPNNYPTLYGIRILKNGTEIFKKTAIQTTTNWTLQVFDFIDLEAFTIEENTSFRIELLPYCPIGDASPVSAWDLDEFKIYAGCVSPIKVTPVIDGNVFTKAEQSIPNVNIHLSEHSDFSQVENRVTDDNGYYLFDPLKRGQGYFLKGYKNDDVMNGVSTLDLIHIQKHLLGKEPFTSLHQYVAADVNRNDKVNVMDLVDLRKLLLGQYSVFPGNNSWRFGTIPQDLNGKSLSDFQEIVNIEYLENDTQRVNFMGIKIGDVNEDILLTTDEGRVETRNEEHLSLLINDIQPETGTPFTVDFRMDGQANIAGLQLAINIHDLSLVELIGLKIPLTSENFSFKDGILRISWNQTESVFISNQEILFSLTLLANQNSSMTDKITLSKEHLTPEAYTVNGNAIYSLDLKTDNSSQHQSEILFFQVDPNPFQAFVNIRFNLLTGGKSSLRLFDVFGRIIQVIEKDYGPGEHLEQINADEIISGDGVIYCQLICNGYSGMQRLIKLK